MMKLVTLFLLMFLMVCSYQVKNTDEICNDTVRIICYNKHGRIEEKTTKILKKEKLLDKTIFFYNDNSKSNNNVKGLPEKIIIFKNIDSIEFSGQKCYLRDFKIYSIKNKEFKIYRYLFDFSNLVSEESEIYVNDSIGLIRRYSIYWGNLETYVKDTFGSELNKALWKDTSTFVRNKLNRERYHKEFNEFIKNRENNKR